MTALIREAANRSNIGRGAEIYSSGGKIYCYSGVIRSGEKEGSFERASRSPACSLLQAMGKQQM